MWFLVHVEYSRKAKESETVDRKLQCLGQEASQEALQVADGLLCTSWVAEVQARA